MQPRVHYDHEALRSFCRKWLVTDFCLFGSALRQDFNDASDVDVVVDFEPQADWSLVDLGRMQEDLEVIFGRQVDLLTREAVREMRNPIRRRIILDSLEPLNVA